MMFAAGSLATSCYNINYIKTSVCTGKLVYVILTAVKSDGVVPPLNKAPRQEDVWGTEV
jgi:hypothetical protein